jgi:hypothetical protein
MAIPDDLTGSPSSPTAAAGHSPGRRFRATLKGPGGARFCASCGDELPYEPAAGTAANICDAKEML